MDGLSLIYEKTRKVHKDLFWAVAFVVIETFFEVVIPFLMADIIDVGILSHDMNFILRRGLWMLVCAVLSIIFGYAYSRCAAKASAGAAWLLRHQVFETISTYSFSNIDQFETSGLITRLTSDITVIQNAITNGIRPIVRGPIMLVFGLGMSLMINVKMTLIFFCAIPLLGLILVFIVSKVAPQYGLLQKSVDALNGLVQENLMAIRLVKSFVSEESESRKFAQVNSDLAKLTTHTFRYAQLNQPAFQASMYGVILALMIVGMPMILNGSMMVGELTGILSYVLQIMNSMMMLSNVFLLLTRSMASIRRIEDVFEQRPTILPPENPKTMKDGSVVFDHVDFAYSSDAAHPVLEDISLTIPSGSTTGIIGATGSGKTSLVGLISRLYDITGGSLKVGQEEISQLDPEDLHKEAGVVLQNNVLFSGTVKDNLLWGNPEASDAELEEACRVACVDELLPKLENGLDSELGQLGVNVSGGQKQRICIARALLRKPKILILDDSLSAVDMATDAKIRAGLNELKDLTKIIIGQRISSVENCDQIVVMDNGSIADVGTHEELMGRCAIYQEIAASQKKGDEEDA